MIGLVFALALGCGSRAVVEDDRCELDLAAVEPAAARPGETVVGTGDGPFIDERDTVVFVAGIRTPVTQANGGTDDCLRCLGCRLEAGCSVCDATCAGSEDQAPSRISECFAEAPSDTGFVVGGEGVSSYCSRCSFEIEFVVPDVPPGPTEVWAVGEIGTSRPVPFEVEAPEKPTP